MALIRKAKVKHNDFFDFELKNGELILKKVKL